MKLYRVHWRHPDHESLGYSYHTSRKDVAAARREAEGNPETAQIDNIEEITVPLTKEGVLRALRLYGCHPDNG